MTQPDHSPQRSQPHGPKQRGDSIRPANTRQSGDRRPYPTASTTTRVSPAKPGPVSTRARSGGSAATPIPATVWIPGLTAVGLDLNWPTPIVHAIVSSFSKPRAQVVLLPWPGSAESPSLGAGGVIEQAPAAGSQAEVADALEAVEDLGRSGRVVRVAAERNLAGPTSRPFWADLVGPDVPSPTTASTPSPFAADSAVLDGPDAVAADTDLIITSLRPCDSGDHISDLVALIAARLLRVGGILAVITHSDWSCGELIDPTGAVIAAAQNADLLYLQHIVALHAPVSGGRFATELIPDPDGATAEQHARAAHRAAVRGLPAPHQRIHSDVLVFAQPHEHEPLPVSPAEHAHASEVIR